MTSDDGLAEAVRALEKLATPTILRRNLIRAALLITAFETLRDRITSPLVGFFASNWGPDGPLESDDYRQEVRSLHKKKFEASCQWFLNQGAITQDDLDSIYACRHHRNDVTHEILKYLIDPEHEIELETLNEVARLHTKIDRWWVREIETASNPDFDGFEVSEDEIRTGTMMAMDLIRALALQEHPEDPGTDA